MDVHALLSGERRGMASSLLRTGLWAAQAPYALATAWRNRRYDRDAAAIHRVRVPVISVGNITTGGTGKTPLVDYLARRLRNEGLRVAIVSRGYGAERGAKNDEALELELRLPDVPHLQNPDRFEGASTAIEEFESEVIVLDDGFQHRRLHRDLDFVLLDALAPFGYGHVLPRGLLRESLRGLRRASALVLSRADAVDPARREQIRHQALRFAGNKPWIEVAHAPQQLVNGDQTEALESLRGKHVAAFCGIGNPDGFRHTLATCGCHLNAFRAFPDHHGYRREDVESLTEWAQQSGAEMAVCTEKDWVKIQVPHLSQLPLWAVRIGISVLQGEAELNALLRSVVRDS